LPVKSPSAGHERILLVEPDAEALERLRRLLKGEYEVRGADSADVALASVRLYRPDLVLLRVGGASLDGLALLGELRAAPRTQDVPVILLAALAEEEACLVGLDFGANDYLIEPFHPRALPARIQLRLRSARVRREAARREHAFLTEASLAALIESSEDAIISETLDGTITSWNQAAENIFGYTREEMIGRSISVLAPPDRPDETSRILEAVRQGERVRHTETERIRKDGRRIYISISVSPIKDAAGRIVGVSKIARDITHRKQGEELLRQSEERFRLATEAISGLVYDWDVESGQVQRSKGLVSLLGYWPEEVESELDWWKRQIHPEDYDRVYQHIVPAVEAGAPSFNVEYRVRHRDGHWVHVWDKGLLVRDAGGRPRRVVGSTIDISDRKRVESELRRANEEARAASEAKDRFLATLSHELRTPLTPVLAVISSLENDPEMRQKLRSELEMIRRNVELEARLIDDLLDLTRIARGKLELHRRSINVRQVLEHALETAAPELEARELQLTVDLTAADRLLSADAPRLTQVFWNLLSNAIKFTPPGGKIEVCSWVEPTGGGGEDLVVEVADTGIGIEPDVLPRIFDAFEQADRRITRRFGGLGLGLAVTRAIVELHGGRLAAASEGRDRGASFQVRLPLGIVQMDLEDSGGSFTRPQPSGPVEDEGRPLHILLVEDHPDTAEAMADLLRLMGHQVTVAGTVASALETAGSGRAGFDLVVSDIGLPDGSGQDLMRELVGRHGLRGIALSGYGMEEDIRKSREAGFSAHLIKPVSPQVLRDAIRRAASLPARGR
jgi:two-component system, chemotaxis family, CheB/CheR fusion protein